MNRSRRSARKRLGAIAVSALILGLAPGLANDVSAAKKDKADRPTTSQPAPTPKKAKSEDKRETAPTTTTTTVPGESETPVPVENAWPDFEDLASLFVSDRTTSLSDIVAQVGADDMWAAGYTGAGVDVAVIDTGIAPIAELSTTNVFVGPDLSFEGNIDEVAGLDTYGHGTHMAGIIAGRTPGADPLNPKADDFIGVAPDARIVSVKVADNTGAVDVSQVIAAIDWVVQNQHTNGLNIRVLNLSYNTSGDQSAILDPLSKAVENAWDHGIVVVVAAGNEGLGSFGLASPANNPHIIAVSSAELVDKYGWINPLWAPSGDGTRNPDVLAPGVSVMSLRNPGSRVDTENPTARVDGDDRLFLGSGTSQSAAVVSGAAALLLQQRPDLTPDQVKSLLTETAVSTFQFEIIKGNGVIDLAAAMTIDTPDATQKLESATGLGSLEAARGDDHVTIGDEVLTGEYTVTGAEWDPAAWVKASESATAWSGTDDWSGSSWSGSSWSGSSWSGSSWSGSSWSGSSWSGSSWSGSSWSGSSWSGSSWSGSSWSGSSWSGSSWS